MQLDTVNAWGWALSLAFIAAITLYAWYRANNRENDES
jgi:hypothetical protein